MNQKVIKKLRKFARKHVDRELKGYQALPLKQRLVVAWRVIFKC